MKKPYIYFFVANRHEGCGHRHKTADSARKCKLYRFFPKYRVYRVTTEVEK